MEIKAPNGNVMRRGGKRLQPYWDECAPRRAHDGLRHTAATLWLAQGVDPRTIMVTLGHSQIALTMNTYTHVLPKLQAEAASKLEALLGGTK